MFAVPIYLTHKIETIKVGDETGIIVKPIDPKRPESGRFQGILVGSFDPQMIARNIISPIISGQTGYAWLLDEDSLIPRGLPQKKGSRAYPGFNTIYLLSNFIVMSQKKLI